MDSENERREAVRKSGEELKLLEEKVASGEIRKEALGPACNTVQSNYNLRPR